MEHSMWTFSKSAITAAAAAAAAVAVSFAYTPVNSMPLQGTALKAAVPSAAEAIRWGGGGWHGGGWGGVGAGLAAGAIIGGLLAQPNYYPYGYGAYPYGYGYGYGPVYVQPAPPVVYGAPDDAVAYCMQRFRSYDTASGTYLGFDGYRHPCP
jgi:hypothetical protein